jgi:hypothetical protein
MDFNKDPLYAGLSGVNLAVETFDLGHEIVLTRTFARLNEMFFMHFVPTTPDQPFPKIIKDVKTGFGLDINVQLYIPNWKTFGCLDRLNIVWLIAVLIRLKTNPAVIIPVVADRPFASIPESWEEAEIIPMEEVSSRRLVPVKSRKLDLDETDLVWIREHWQPSVTLMNNNREFNTAVQAVDFSLTAKSSSLALITLWGALEQLFSPAKQELRFRVSASIASYLEPPGSQRLALYKKTLKLYDARSEAAHGTSGKHTDPLIETYALIRRILIKMIEDGHVPDRDEIEKLMFGCE